MQVLDEEDRFGLRFSYRMAAVDWLIGLNDWDVSEAFTFVFYLTIYKYNYSSEKYKVETDKLSKVIKK